MCVKKPPSYGVLHCYATDDRNNSLINNTVIVAVHRLRWHHSHVVAQYTASRHSACVHG